MRLANCISRTEYALARGVGAPLAESYAGPGNGLVKAGIVVAAAVSGVVAFTMNSMELVAFAALVIGVTIGLWSAGANKRVQTVEAEVQQVRTVIMGIINSLQPMAEPFTGKDKQSVIGMMKKYRTAQQDIEEAQRNYLLQRRDIKSFLLYEQSVVGFFLRVSSDIEILSRDKPDVLGIPSSRRNTLKELTRLRVCRMGSPYTAVWRELEEMEKHSESSKWSKYRYQELGDLLGERFREVCARAKAAGYPDYSSIPESRIAAYCQAVAFVYCQVEGPVFQEEGESKLRPLTLI